MRMESRCDCSIPLTNLRSLVSFCRPKTREKTLQGSMSCYSNAMRSGDRTTKGEKGKLDGGQSQAG
jgi:hypothetical protein